MSAATMASLPMGIPDLCSGGDQIAAGATRTIVGAESFGCLGIHGTLILGDHAHVTATTIMVYPDGHLIAGSSRQPGTDIEIVFNDVAPRDSDRYGTGLLVFGELKLYGQPVTPSFVRLAAEPAAGSSTLALSSAVNWKASDRLIIPDTRQLQGNESTFQWEELAVAGVSGTNVTLTKPLTFAHQGARDDDGVLRFLPHVGNLSRSIVLRSANPTGARGHVLATSRADVDIRYVLFKDLGRTTIQPLDNDKNHIGRYSLHMHHLTGPAAGQSNGYQFTLIGNAIDGGSKWGITVHDSHYGLVQDNVVYNVGGAGFVTEDGSETKNVFDHNFAVRIFGTGPHGDRADGREDAQDWGWEGSAYWFRGPDNIVTNNVGANTWSWGFTFMMVRTGDVNVPKRQGADPMSDSSVLNPQKVPLRQFENNEIYGGTHGMTIWNLGASCCTGMYDIGESVVKNQVLWHINWGYFTYSHSHLTFDHWVHYGDPALLSASGQSLAFGDYPVRYTVIKNAIIHGIKTAFVASIKPGDTRCSEDVYCREPGTMVVRDSDFRATENASIHNEGAVTGGKESLPDRQLFFINNHFRKPKTLPDWAWLNVNLTMNQDVDKWNLRVKDEIIFTTHNGIAGNDFRVYYAKQAPGYVMESGDGVGSPQPGLTNAQLWEKYGIATGGAVAPCSTVVAGYGNPTRYLDGQAFVCGSIAPEPAPTPAPGSDPTPALSTPMPPPDKAIRRPVSMGEGWTRCADERTHCTFSGTHEVRFGAEGKFITKAVTDGIECTNEAFGSDPVPGMLKICDVSPDGPAVPPIHAPPAADSGLPVVAVMAPPDLRAPRPSS